MRNAEIKDVVAERVGRLRVREVKGGKVWLAHDEGEAGTFPAAEVERVRHDAAALEAYFWRAF